ncbi:MAG: hypothetical protein ACLUFI_15410 [Oscillospiraceae bacterium]
MKGLYWEKDGFILLYKRLEQGAYRVAALGIRGEGANAAAVPLAHGGAADRAAESPPSGNGIDHCLSRENRWKPWKTPAFCRILWYNVCMENREMQTSNTAEMVTISRAEYERFQKQSQVITGLTLQNEWLLEQLKLSQKKLFGRSSGTGGADGHGAAEFYFTTRRKPMPLEPKPPLRSLLL